jgi:type IV pilus assembly protein PilE
MRSRMNDSKAPGRRRARGFTLVELMVVVAIIAALTAIAVPSYRNYMVRTHRNAAKACLAESAQFMERYYTTNLDYDVPVDEFELGCHSDSGMDDRYDFTVVLDEADPMIYTVTATPKDAQATGDTLCGVLGMDQTGARTESGTGDEEDCW